MDRIIGHIDMDCFFCACEVKKDPSLKGKPVIVGSTGDRGVVSTASYEAREYGVFSATPISIARKRCPDGIFLPVDGKLYKQESEKVMEILSRFSMTMKKMSIDEAYVDLTELYEEFDDLDSMARMIKNTIYTETGLTCSIGIADSTIVAKIASDYRKPAGITVVEDTQSFLKDLPISKIPGVGKMTEDMLRDAYIDKIGDFAEKSRAEVYEKFGKQGLFYKELAEGKVKDRIEMEGPRKSVSRETTLEKDTKDIIILEKEVEELCEQVFQDLGGCFYRTVSIKIRYSDFTTISRDHRLKTPSNKKDIIKEIALSLFRKSISNRQGIRLLGVKLGQLSDDGQKTLDTK